MGAFTDGREQADGAAATALEAWTLALQLTEDEDDAVRGAVSAALGAAVAADAGSPAAEQACRDSTRPRNMRTPIRVGANSCTMSHAYGRASPPREVQPAQSLQLHCGCWKSGKTPNMPDACGQ